MVDQLPSFDGKVLLVTGGARGLGRAYVDALVRRGADVALNDIDEPKASLEQPSPAGSVFFVPGSAVDGAGLVERVLARAGRIDGLVLNAGFLRDRSFAKAEEADLRDLLDVHLVGPWRAARAAWPTMIAQGHGRIVFTTSPAGLYGQFGQSGYSAAKAALVGLTRTLALEGAKHGIGVNCVAPLAASRLSEGVLPPSVAARLPPAAVAGLVAWLCHPSCAATGQVYEAAGGTIARHVVHRGLGVHLGPDPSLEAVSGSWDAINDVGAGESPASTADALLRFANRWPDAADPGDIA